MSAPQRGPPVTSRRPPGVTAPILARHPHPSRTGAPSTATPRRAPGQTEADLHDLALARSAWKAMVLVYLGAPRNAQPAWSVTPLPALSNIGALRGSTAFVGLDAHRILHNDSAPTALEAADGNWGAAQAALGGPALGASLASLAAAFDQHLAPARRQPSTRLEHWRAWSLVLTWAVARRCLHRLLPMDLETMKALTWDLVSFCTPSSRIEAVWGAVQARHRRFGLVPPLNERNQFTSWSRMLNTVRGRPLALKLPIQSATVRWLLLWRPTGLAANRARLLTALATIACLRVNEVARLQVCDLWFDYLASYGVSGFEGTCSVHVDRRKNDTVRKGHYPALGRSFARAADIVQQLRVWMRLAGIVVSPACCKRASPAARCTVCPPLFPLTTRVRGGLTIATDRPCSRQQASDMIRWAVAQAGGCSDRFSGISARKGGISTAIAAGVDETILYLQSGHGQPLPARAYMHLHAPARFLETFEAFGL